MSAGADAPRRRAAGRRRPLRALRRSLRPRDADRRARRAGGGLPAHLRARGLPQRARRPARHYAGRPTPLYFARRASEALGGARVYLKREDLAHTGAHKINNVLGQALLARFMGKRRVIAETGAGQHGVATATACALLGLDCEVYMGEEDVARQALNVFRMELLGAKVHPVKSGSRTLKDAINEAMRDWVTNVRSTYYCIGSVMGPHPYPTLVRDFQRVIGARGARADPGARGPAARRAGRLRRRRLERDRPLPPVPRATRACASSASSRAGRACRRGRHGAALTARRRRASSTASARSCSPTTTARSSRRTRSPRARLPGRRARARLAARHGPRRVRGGDRRGGARRVPVARAHRGHPPGARVARTRSRSCASSRRPSAGTRS